MYTGILNHGGRRYLWWALVITAISTLVYFSQDASQPPSGGTWQGYGLGGLGVLLILWLAWLGIRKRSYKRNSGSVRGWVSAHVYLGLTLPVIATLHCAFQFGMNIHTLAYVLMMIVIVSGGYGLYVYLRYPRAQVGNRENQSQGERLAELDALDQQAIDAAAHCDDSVYGVVTTAVDKSVAGGNFMDQLLGRDNSRVRLPGKALASNRDQKPALDYLVHKLPESTRQGEAQHLRELISIFGRRAELLRRLRREISIDLRLKLWLCVHVPLTIGLIAALIAHIVSVFFYW